MSVSNKKIYTSEFKESAVKLAIESKVSPAQIARELGINKNTLYTWINMNIQTPDIASFNQSRSQIAVDMARQISRSKRNL
ncbi:transposase [Rickettsia endosymbiont of Orchestes rusci]|uniref:transposase n=1 Tax=Rickettsia endosymbiont of Orchestes rusci TaxID=3066250 RepID=UPI00313BFDE8